MSEHESEELAGPDLVSTGVPVEDLPEGGTLLGHAHGEAVVLARRGQQVFAVGATCTHYGGPLAEGVFDGELFHCPWHHACFKATTGAAVRPPALSPVTSYSTAVRNGRIFVGGKSSATPADTSSPSRPVSVVIVGTGAAGNAAAETLRAEGYDGPITMIGLENAIPYDRPSLSKDYLAGTVEDDAVPLHSQQFYTEKRIDLMLGVDAVAIDVGKQEIALSDGRQLRYGALLLATGANPIQLDTPGRDLPHVHYLRTLADSRAIIENASRATQAVIIGASFIGLEVAASLVARGLEVHVVAPEARPMERILGPEMGDFVRSLHEEHGVQFHLEQTVERIDEQGVTLKNGQLVEAGLVVFGVGVRPATKLAEDAGLAMDRGVVVDEYLQTSAPNIFAAGDIARWPDPYTGERIRVEHWVVAERQGQTAALNILGRRERFDAVPFFWSQHYDVPINYVGHAESWDSIDVQGGIADRDCVVAYRKDGKTLAIASIYRDVESLRAELAMERRQEQELLELVHSG